MKWLSIDTYDKETCPRAILAFPGGEVIDGHWWKGYPEYKPEGGWRVGTEEILIMSTETQPWKWMPWPAPPEE